jgi:hypothetical protein
MSPEAIRIRSTKEDCVVAKAIETATKADQELDAIKDTSKPCAPSSRC